MNIQQSQHFTCADYIFNNRLNLQSLPENYVDQLKTLKFEFKEYKANQALACHIYEKGVRHCANQYGLLQDFQRKECLDMAQFFNQCVATHAAYGAMKRYFPDMFITSSFTRAPPKFNSLYIQQIMHQENFYFTMHLVIYACDILYKLEEKQKKK